MALDKSKIKETVLKYTPHYYKDGWWHGWDELQENVNIDLQTSLSVKALKKIMYELKADGLVSAFPIFTDELKLNGKGWFKGTK